MEEKVMDNVITEEQINTAVEEIVEAGNADLMGFMTKVGVVGGVVLVCYLGYKYIAKPALDKRKAKKEELEQLEIVEEYDPADVDEKTEE